MTEQSIAVQVIESLRKGIPPQRGVDLYTVGNEKLIENITRFHLSGIGERGIIRFISGSWGAGKTHFFRLLREVAFQNNCMVSNVELGKSEAPLDKFERVFYAIIRRVSTPSCFAQGSYEEAAPFGIVLREALAYLATGERALPESVTHEQFERANNRLMADRSIDIDFKKMIAEYWRTFLPDAVEPSIQEQERAEILQWFGGEGTVGGYRKRYNVNKVVNKDNAKLMLQSLAGFVRMSGYNGLVILFDEAEMSFTAMRNTQLRDAHNNLLSLINNVESLTGLFLIYATVPDFYKHPKHGIEQYGALAGRIGKPADRPPRALDTVWNLDEVSTSLSDYQTAAKRIKAIYARAYSEVVDTLPSDEQVEALVADLDRTHPKYAGVRFWRVLVTATVKHFDDALEGDVRSAEEIYDDVMDILKEG